MDKIKVKKIAIEAASLLFSNPNWTYKKSIETARGLIEDAEKVSRMEKTS